MLNLDEDSRQERILKCFKYAYCSISFKIAQPFEQLQFQPSSHLHWTGSETEQLAEYLFSTWVPVLHRNPLLSLVVSYNLQQSKPASYVAKVHFPEISLSACTNKNVSSTYAPVSVTCCSMTVCEQISQLVLKMGKWREVAQFPVIPWLSVFAHCQ